MKINHGLLIVAMVIISLLAVGVASASENVSDLIETSDSGEVMAVDDNLEEVMTVEDNFEDVVAVENDIQNLNVLSEGDGNDPTTPNSTEDSNSEDNSSNNSFDWTVIYGGNVTDNHSLVIDLANILGEKSGKGSFLVLDMTSFFNENETGKGSFLIIDLSNILGKNNTDGTSLLVMDLSGIISKQY